MTTSEIPEDVRGILAYPLDFAVDEIPSDPIWFSTQPVTELVPLAGEGTGGLYAMLAASGEILFVDSEGSGGIIASSLTALLELILSHPYWQDLLKFSGGGDLAEMRRTASFAATDYYACYPEAAAACQRMSKRLGISTPGDPIGLLHKSVSESPQRLRLFAPDGSELESLFKRFTVDSNHTWSDKGR